MVASFLITAREGLEASLILGILLGYVYRTGRRSHARIIWLGAGLAVLASLVLAAAVFFTISELKGRGEELLEGAAAFMAAGQLSLSQGSSILFWSAGQCLLMGSLGSVPYSWTSLA